MFASFHMQWRELTKDNMYEKADELKKIKKEDYVHVKKIPDSLDALFEEKRVKMYKSKLEEMIARKKDNSKLGGKPTEAAPQEDTKDQSRRQSVKLSPGKSQQSGTSPVKVMQAASQR